MNLSKSEQVLELARLKGIIRPRDLSQYNIPTHYPMRLARQGHLERIGYGLYSLPNAVVTENHSFAEVSKRVSHGVICLLSALRFHELTTQDPFEIWMAIDGKARLPILDSPQTRFVRFSGQVLAEGVETHSIESVPVRIYSATKTVADCFKYRNKIGLDIAIEALRDCLARRKEHSTHTVDEIWYYAKICRVANVIRPHIETILS